MYEQVEKPKENKSKAVANFVTQKKSGGKQGLGFVDNRYNSVSQRKIRLERDESRILQLAKKVINSRTQETKDVEDDYTLAWGEKFVTEESTLQGEVKESKTQVVVASGKKKEEVFGSAPKTKPNFYNLKDSDISIQYNGTRTKTMANVIFKFLASRSGMSDTFIFEVHVHPNLPFKSGDLGPCHAKDGTNGADLDLPVAKAKMPYEKSLKDWYDFAHELLKKN